MTIERAALGLWGLQGASVSLVADRENRVFRVDHTSGTFALRHHRPGYRTDAQLLAELAWTAELAASGLSVAPPVRSGDGRFLRHIDGVQIDMLEWLNGTPLSQTLAQADTRQAETLFRDLGRGMARLHLASDAWPGATTCDRPSWDLDGLLGAHPLWDRFWGNPALLPDMRALFQSFRAKAQDELGQLAGGLDYGLIHADLVPDNIMVDGQDLHFIDFDDGGFGFRLFEIATALLKHHARADFADIQAAMINGYQSERPIDLTKLDLFLALRAATYVGWNITRAAEDITGARNTRFIAQAATFISRYMDR